MILPFALVALVVVLALNNVRLVRAARLASGAQRSLKTNDEDIVALLEAHAETSVLAKRLLVEAAAPKLLAAVDSQSWQHDPNVTIPPDEQWKILRETFLREISDDARAMFILRLVDAGKRFTDFEKAALLERIGGATEREVACEALYPKKIAVESLPPPPFRWSKQSTKMICTMTCECGEPATASFGPQLRIRCTKNKCSTYKEPLYTGIVMTNRMIFVEADGVPWACINGSWVKAAID